MASRYLLLKAPAPVAGGGWAGRVVAHIGRVVAASGRPGDYVFARVGLLTGSGTITASVARILFGRRLLSISPILRWVAQNATNRLTTATSHHHCTPGPDGFGAL